MKVLIVYERKNRELENACLLKLKLEERGHECNIVQFYQVESYCSRGDDVYDIILVPHLYNSQEVYRTLSRFGKSKRILNLQYEQVLSDKWEKLGHHTPSGLASSFEHVCWGVKTEERLLNAGVEKEKIHTVGAIQLDLLREEYRNEYEIKQSLADSFSLDVSKKWNLFLSSFTYADIEESRLKMNEAVAGTCLKNFVPIHSKSRLEIINWLEDAAYKHSDELFIYRPHPDELNLDVVKELSEKCDNIIIINELSAKLWIESCDRVISWYSTTLVESHFLNKPYSILRPFTLPSDFDSVLLKKGEFLESKTEFLDNLSSIYKKKALADKDVEEYYMSSSTSSFSKIIEVIERNDVSNQGEDIYIPMSVCLKTLIVKSFLKFINKVNNSKFGFVFNKIAFYRRWSNEVNQQAYTSLELDLLTSDINGRLRRNRND